MLAFPLAALLIASAPPEAPAFDIARIGFDQRCGPNPVLPQPGAAGDVPGLEGHASIGVRQSGTGPALWCSRD